MTYTLTILFVFLSCWNTLPDVGPSTGDCEQPT